MQYFDTELKKESEIAMKNGFMKSYKILRAQGDDAGWNAPPGHRHRRPEGYGRMNGSVEIQQVVGTKFMREIVLK